MTRVRFNSSRKDKTKHPTVKSDNWPTLPAVSEEEEDIKGNSLDRQGKLFDLKLGKPRPTWDQDNSDEDDLTSHGAPFYSDQDQVLCHSFYILVSQIVISLTYTH